MRRRQFEVLPGEQLFGDDAACLSSPSCDTGRRAVETLTDGEDGRHRARSLYHSYGRSSGKGELDDLISELLIILLFSPICRWRWWSFDGDQRWCVLSMSR
nr:hypothetical protein Itr_chr06CG22380 [Ipomoea trifida]